ncbi:MAG TPA: YbjQ family protein [Bacteroidia bacterium]|nr:YbjQ family protein [Bacteroidia bacterium]
MKITTTESCGSDVKEILGIVDGHIISSKNIIQDYITVVRSFFGGELKEYTVLLESAKKEATNRMIEKAKELGANAIVGVRYDIAGGEGAEVFVYGTAVQCFL